LSKALKLRDVKFVEGKIACFDSKEPVLLNISEGGMKVLMEQKLRDKIANVSTLYGNPSVYCLQISSLDQPSIKILERWRRKDLRRL
jgi:c-di-GMP-binding flagellar brake protein YcgR